MAKWIIASIKDELAGENGTFMQPTAVKDMVYILRSFEFEMNKNEIMKDNASDFSLYSLGTFDDETGELKAEMKKIMTGTNVLRKEQNE